MDKYEINARRLNLFQQLHSYGDVIPLQFWIDPDRVRMELEPFEKNWVRYNPEKDHIQREGLSLTSLDGGMSGIPDLFSLYEYCQKNNVKLSEGDFNKTTEAYRACLSIHPLFETFLPNVGRSRFVRFRAGGHFPPHRDGSVNFQIPDYFRLFTPLAKTGKNELYFTYDGRILDLEPGRVYLFNALKVHSVFSFADGAMTLAVSVQLTQENVAKAIKSFQVY